MGRDTLNLKNTNTGYSRYVTIEDFISRDDNDVIDWVMFATQQELDRALLTHHKGDWAIYYMLRTYRDNLKKDIGWVKKRPKKKLDKERNTW